jgi:cytoskeletal protein CcmA (bactofilin family)
MLKRFAPPQPTPPSAPVTKPATPVEEAPKQEVQAVSAPAETKPEPKEVGNKLIVGPNIKLKGSEITDCDILLVEGRVEASMNSRDMRIAEGGIFVGVAEIDIAEVRGEFEGELIARKRLVIHATGKVSGKIRYGTLSVEDGGVLSGDVGPLAAKTPENRAGQSGKDAAEEHSKLDAVRPTHAAFGNRGALHQR